MAYQVGEEVQFVQQVTRTNPDRVINVDEKATIAAVAADGSYTVKLLSGESVSGITDADLEPSVALPGDSLPQDSTTHPQASDAKAAPAPDTDSEA